MPQNKFDDSLKRFLEDDGKLSKLLCQNITTLNDQLTWESLVTSGTLRLLEEQMRKVAGKLLNGESLDNVVIVNRTSRSVTNYPAYVVTGAYLRSNDDQE